MKSIFNINSDFVRQLSFGQAVLAAAVKNSEFEGLRVQGEGLHHVWAQTETIGSRMAVAKKKLHDPMYLLRSCRIVLGIPTYNLIQAPKYTISGSSPSFPSRQQSGKPTGKVSGHHTLGEFLKMSSIWLRVHDLSVSRTPIIHKVGPCDPLLLTSGRNITPTRTQVGRDSTNFRPPQRRPRTFICLSSAKLLCCGTTNRLCIAFCWIRCLGVLFSGFHFLFHYPNISPIYTL